MIKLTWTKWTGHATHMEIRLHKMLDGKIQKEETP